MNRSLVPLPGAFMVWMTVSVAIPGDAAAQSLTERNFHEGMMTGVGYTASMPDVLAGVGVWRLFGGQGIGVFLDGKLTLPSLTRSRNYCPPELGQCTVEWVSVNRPGDGPLRDEREWLLLNAGGVYPLTPEFAVMVGAGAARLRRIREMVDEAAAPDDPRDPITETGVYYVEHTPDPTWKMQGVVAVLLRAGPNLAFRFGYESGPGGLSLGAYFVLP